MVFILNKEYDMNSFLKQSTGSKRIYFYIICTGGVLSSPLNREVQVQTLTEVIVPCSRARHLNQCLAHCPDV